MSTPTKPPYVRPAQTPPKLLTPFDRVIRAATRGRVIRGLTKWPAMLPFVEQGLVRFRFDPANPDWAIFELTDRGRREYRFQAEWHGK